MANFTTKYNINSNYNWTDKKKDVLRKKYCIPLDAKTVTLKKSRFPKRKREIVEDASNDLNYCLALRFFIFIFSSSFNIG